MTKPAVGVGVLLVFQQFWETLLKSSQTFWVYQKLADLGACELSCTSPLWPSPPSASLASSPSSSGVRIWLSFSGSDAVPGEARGGWVPAPGRPSLRTERDLCKVRSRTRFSAPYCGTIAILFLHYSNNSVEIYILGFCITRRKR